MKKGLFSKMTATFTIIIIISYVITATVLSIWFQGYYFEQRRSQLLNEIPFIQEASESYLTNSIQLDSVKDRIRYISKSLNVDIILADHYGYVYAVSNDNLKNLEQQQTQVLAGDEISNLMHGNIIDTNGAYTKLFKPKDHTIIVPMHSSGGIFIGAVIMNTSITEMRNPLYKVYNIIWISAAAAVIFLACVMYYFSKKIIIKPLAKINYVADKISKGEVDKRVDIDSEDEIGKLAKSFNSMADFMEQIDNNRRIFISNVSHELRSPITSIKGFISGILDGVIPPEKVNYYLSLTYEEIQRLTRLVNDLLDLSAIEAGQFTLNVKQIDVNELIRITIVKFETQVKKKKIKVDVLLDGDNLYVLSDWDRLVQIVTNLLDNAVKYVNDNGNIKLSTKLKGSKVYVSVFNDGPKILDQDLKHIWDRFYKADKSRTSKTSTGLGLPIVRNILTQLGEDIWVENQKNGVKFTFTLKKA